MKIKSFIRSWALLLSSLSYYPTMLKKPWTTTLWFFIASCLILGLIAATRWNIVVIPLLQPQVQESLTTVSEHFPEDLRVEWTGTQLLIDTPTPVAINYPAQLMSEDEELPPTMGYVVSTALTPTDFSQLPTRSMFVVTPENVYVHQTADQWSNVGSAEILDSSAPFILTKAEVPALVDRLLPTLQQTLKILGYSLFMFMPLLMVPSLGWISLINSLLLFLITRLTGLRLSFTKLWQLTVYVVLVAELVSQVGQWLYQTPAFSLFSLTFWVLMTLALMQIRSNLAHGPRQHQ